MPDTDALDRPGAPSAASGVSKAQLVVRTVHRRAVEAAIWGIPIVNYDLMYQAFTKISGGMNQIAYWSRLLDWKNQTTTPNPNSIYFMPFFDTEKAGPIVIEIPPAEGGSITGTLMDCWQTAFEDVGPADVDEAARIGGAMARAHTFASPMQGVFYYPDRKWQGVPAGLNYTFTRDGIPQVDARTNVYYMAAGNSPGMMDKNVGQGSQYLWTYRDADGQWLDGGKTYRLHVLPGIPAGNFWSVVVYDALSRSELQNGQKLPSVSAYTDPVVNADGSIDIDFGPEEPAGKANWVRTVPGKGWFPIFRFYGPAEAFFDKSWKLEDIEKI